jgi:hypothetical protein
MKIVIMIIIIIVCIKNLFPNNSRDTRINNRLVDLNILKFFLNIIKEK